MSNRSDFCKGCGSSFSVVQQWHPGYCSLCTETRVDAQQEERMRIAAYVRKQVNLTLPDGLTLDEHIKRGYHNPT